VAWLANATAPGADTTAPRTPGFVHKAKLTSGGFADGLRNTDVVSATISVLRRANGRCQGLTRSGAFKTMTCSKAATTFIANRLLLGDSGPQWAIRRALPKGRYTIRVRGRDAAGNVNRHPKALILTRR
jgi:hypothetical protein